jgi:hypothetical protein
MLLNSTTAADRQAEFRVACAVLADRFYKRVGGLMSV